MPIRFSVILLLFPCRKNAFVIHAITVVIVMSFAVNIGFHIQRTVLALLLNRIHILRHLDRQTAGRVVTAEDNVEHSGSRNTELCDDRIGFGFKFMHHHRVVDGCADDHRLVAHRAAAFENIVEISLVIGSVCLSKIAAVREILAEITVGNAHLTRFFRRIRAVLQCNRQIAVAAVRKIFGGIRVACRAFDKYQRHIGLLR